MPGSAWGKSWGKSWANSWGSISEDVTGEIASAQVQSTGARAISKSSFQGAPAPGVRHPFLDDFRGTVVSSQYQSEAVGAKVAQPVPKPVSLPGFKARIRSYSKAGLSHSHCEIVDPVAGVARSSTVQGRGGVEFSLSYFASVQSYSGGGNKGIGVNDQWNDEEIAMVISLLAA